MADTSQTTARRIDVHAHFLPDFYGQALLESGHARPDGMAGIPAWDARAAIAFMDQQQIETSLLSISSPGVHLGAPVSTVDLARRVNEEGARLRRNHPGRFGFFASLPLPHHEEAVAEAIFALDVLGADGVIIETNHDGAYLGDGRLEPLWAELDARAAVVLVHPTSPASSCIEHHPKPMLEFMFETTRSIADLVLAGVTARYPSIRFILPHAGAALPVLANRIDAFASLGAGESRGPMAEAMRRFYFDLAGMPVPQLLKALLEHADPKHLLYGSDYPFTPTSACAGLADQLAATPLLSEDERRGMWRENALALLPKRSIGAELARTMP